MRKLIATSLLLVLLLTPVREGRASSPATPRDLSTAYELIDAVNALRASYGLAPYQANSILMSIAQTHAEYLASIQTGSHLDANGLLPYQRALAAGYPIAGDFSNGRHGWFSENLVGGQELDAAGAVERWMGDAPHQLTMLSANLQDVGAGVGISGNVYYYVLDCGSSTGGAAVASTMPPPTSSQTTLVLLPNTPNADGSIIHVVRLGDTLGSISLAYDVSLEDILNLNGLTMKSVIYENQEIVLRAAYTPTPTQPTSTPTRQPTSTLWPTSTITLTATPIPPTPTPAPALPLPAASRAVGAIVVAALLIAGLVALLGKKRK